MHQLRGIPYGLGLSHPPVCYSPEIDCCSWWGDVQSENHWKQELQTWRWYLLAGKSSHSVSIRLLEEIANCFDIWLVEEVMR